jgi:hypothetical protein
MKFEEFDLRITVNTIAETSEPAIPIVTITKDIQLTTITPVMNA